MLLNLWLVRDSVKDLKTHEITWLGFQNRVWGEQAFAIWKQAGFAPGQTILDVGCGPGFGTLELS